jgi:hypothetical protein
MLGGSATNKQIFTFGQPEGWVDLGTSLPNPIANPSTSQCAIITGDDGSKVLEMYDMGVAPNQVTRYALWTNNAPAPVGQVVGGPSSKRRRRDLTVNNWPAYNSTLAPTDTRSGFALATSPDGLAVISGGDSSDPVAIFDQRENTWVNATSLLVAKNQIPLSTSTPSSSSSLPSVSVVAPTSLATASPSSTSTAAAGGSSSHSKVLTVLGGTLGAIFGLAAILILLLVLLRRKREQNKSTEQEINEKDGRLSFADQGAEFMHEAGGSRGRAYSESINGSVGTLQLFNKSGAKSKVNTHRRGVPSDSSQLGLVKAKSPLGITEPLEMSKINGKTSPTYTNANSLAPSAANSPPRRPNHIPIEIGNLAPAEDPERSRSNGWSRYFANNEVTNLASMQSGRRSTYGTDAGTFTTNESRSEYEDSRKMSSNSSVRPLELNLGPKFDGQRLSRVATGSPTMGHRNDEIPEGLSAKISRAESLSSRGSEPGFTFSSSTRDGNSTRDGPTTWTPATDWSAASNKPGDTKSMGSVYSNGGSSFFPSGVYETDDALKDVPELPNMDFNQYNFNDHRDSHASEASQVTVFPSGLTGSPKLSAFPKGVLAQRPPQNQHDDFDFPMPKAYFGGQNRESTASATTVASNITVFPRGVPSPTTASFPKAKLVDARSPPPVPPVPPVPDSPTLRRGPVIRKTTGDEDMSWLNINAGRAI